jgi:DNA-binding response OmpR family regulator
LSLGWQWDKRHSAYWFGNENRMPQVYTILIVDDETLLRKSLALIFNRAGYLVTTAASPQETRQYLQAGAYDLVFLDLQMPEVDGLTLLREIRAQHADMPVIILTAHATLASAVEAVRLGACDYLLKPFKPNAILDRAREVLAQQQRTLRRSQIASQLNELMVEFYRLQKEPALALPAASGADVIRSGAPQRYLQRGELTLDLVAHRLMVRERQIPLAPLTFNYMMTLTQNAPKVVTYETLVEESQGLHVPRAEARQIAHSRIHELRKAVEPDIRRPEIIVTIRGIGYSLVAS